MSIHFIPPRFLKPYPPAPASVVNVGWGILHGTLMLIMLDPTKYTGVLFPFVTRVLRLSQPEHGLAPPKPPFLTC